MNIALCDDNKDFLLSFHDKIKRCYQDRGIDITIEMFTNGTDLLASNTSYDFVYLDIEMPELSGMQVADIMNKEKKADVIFVSNHDNMVFDTFAYRPLRFLRKSRIASELESVIDATIDNYRIKAKNIEFRSMDGGVMVEKLSDIMYLEISNHTIKVFIKDGNTVCTSGSLSSYEKMLKEDGFVRVHQGFLVNCHYIRELTASDVVMKNGKKVKLSKYKLRSVKQYYHDYLRGLG